MADARHQPTPAASPDLGVTPGATPFGVNEVRLDGRLWLVVLVVTLLLAWGIPVAWQHGERFPTGPDYRIPYDLSKDYWLYQRRLRDLDAPRRAGNRRQREPVILLGDSVVWGEYVLPEGTLSHFLSQEASDPEAFVNAGVNGMFPLAQEGLVRYYGRALHRQRTLLHCNLLWLSSPQADLQSAKEESFNHARLVPQFYPRIPCYRAEANERLSAVVARHVGLVSWLGHVQSAYFGGRSILSWTLLDDGGEPPRYPNACRNPWSQIAMTVPTAPAEDPQRGPKSDRHRPWSAHGGGPTSFDWVKLETSLQWGAFQRLVRLLRARDNQVLVVVGPFNEHMLTADSRAAYLELRAGVIAWLKANAVPTVVPALLPSELYADASHPLTDGYARLAHALSADPTFRHWLQH